METLEHLFWTCDYARALWFASSLGLRTDAFLDINLRQWLFKLLGIEEINGKENHWFAVEFAYTLWYIWIQRNEKIFQGKEPNLTDLMSRIKRTVAKVTEASGMEWQEHQQSSLYVNLLKPGTTKFVSSRAIQGLQALNQGNWLLFLSITKLQDNAWFGHKAPLIEELEEHMQKLNQERASAVLERRSANNDDEMEVEAAVKAAMLVFKECGNNATTIKYAAKDAQAASARGQANLLVKLDEFGYGTRSGANEFESSVSSNMYPKYPLEQQTYNEQPVQQSDADVVSGECSPIGWLASISREAYLEYVHNYVVVYKPYMS
ncbi:hypothetical protein CCACVL1_16123 [Corchorus capsularis]|uniref:Uncharacterized protein n=1 Tax=Corchorus capsularis TaxID=210143 RepID=A0A1R3HZ63_COCAP|nr:hypothetical protein CCACVL1_16123 [Corchorus capsularis]